MDEIVRVMTCLASFVSGHLEPVEYSMSEDYEENYDDNDDEINQDTIDVSWDMSSSQINGYPVNGINNDKIDLLNQPQQLKTIQNSQEFGDSNINHNFPQMKPTSNNNRFQPLHVECDPVSFFFFM